MNILNSSDNYLGGKMLCSNCGKIIEDNGVLLQGHTFCNNLCRYSFEKASKTDDINKNRRSGTKSQIHAAPEIVKKHNKTPGLQIYADERAKMSGFDLIFNNKYFKLVSAILIALIGFLIYRGISNIIEDKQTFRILWICIGFVGFIATVVAKKQNKTPGQQTSIDNQGDKTNFKSIFDNNYLKLVFAILTALLLYKGITNYIEYKQAEATLKDLDKYMIQFEKNMNKLFTK